MHLQVGLVPSGSSFKRQHWEQRFARPVDVYIEVFGMLVQNHSHHAIFYDWNVSAASIDPNTLHQKEASLKMASEKSVLRTTRESCSSGSQRKRTLADLFCLPCTQTWPCFDCCNTPAFTATRCSPSCCRPPPTRTMPVSGSLITTSPGQTTCKHIAPCVHFGVPLIKRAQQARKSQLNMPAQGLLAHSLSPCRNSNAQTKMSNNMKATI